MDRFEEVKLQIKDAIDLVVLVEEYVHLKARGRYHVGLCPFHQEKTPSFTVYADAQYFKCYGCGKAGDVFTFLMERDGMAFREAFEMLAERLAIDLKGVFGHGRGPSRPSENVYATLASVRDWMRHMLQTSEGEAARRYLAERGLTEAIDDFGIGFHPTGGQLRRFVKEQGLAEGPIEQAGLLGRDGYERFAGRLMFPIIDERGRVVGFGGRILESGKEAAKYLNSPEAPFFNKRKLLFGLRQAKQSGERQLIVMEGYTDVIAVHLAGMTGAVATLGTSLTTDHARLLERYATDGAVLLFDGDRAGRQAADRAFRELVHTRLPVRIALLEDGTDPADLVAALPNKSAAEIAAGRETLRSIVDSAEDAMTMWFRLIRQRVDLTLDVHVERVTSDCVRVLVGVADPVRREALGRRMAQHLGLTEGVFLQAVATALRAKERRGAAPGRPAQARPAQRPAQAATTVAGSAGDALEVDESDEVGDPAAAWDQASAGPAAGTSVVPSVVAAAGAGTVASHGGSTGAPVVAGQPELAEPIDPRLAEMDEVLVSCIISAPELLGQVDDVAVTLPGAREILELCRAGVAAGYRTKDRIVGYLFSSCAERNPKLSQLVARCLDRSAHIKSPSETISLQLADRRAHASKQEAQRIRYRLQQARDQDDPELVKRLTQELLEHLRNRGGAA